jgi:hypothetical protein
MAKKRKEGFLQFRCDYALQTKVEDLADSMNKEMGELLREIVSRSVALRIKRNQQKGERQ